MTERAKLFCSNCGAVIIEGRSGVRRNDLHRCDAGRPARCGIWQPRIDYARSTWGTANNKEREALIIQ